MERMRRNPPFVGTRVNRRGRRMFAGATVIVPTENLWWPVAITV
jgi:hypothetical protein